MLKKDMSKTQIEEFLKDKGDFSKIDYLNRYLNESPPIEMKKFAFLKLAEIYQNRYLYNDAAKMYNNAAVNSILFSDKIKYYLKETEMYVKSGRFDRANESIKKALGEANSSQKAEIYLNVKNIYKNQAEKYEKEMKRNNAARIYERLLQMKLSENEKNEIKEKLLRLYDKLGKFSEYNNLKNLIGKD